MSSYIPWILAVLVLGMMAYPILQIVPTKQEKMRIKLRQEARGRGINVQIRKPQLPQAINDSYSHLNSHIAYQRQDINPDIRNTYMAVRSNSGSQQWFWLEGQRPDIRLIEQLLACYAQLPAYISVVEHSPVGHAVFWLERFRGNELEEIDSALKQLAGIFRNCSSTARL